ncbi:MAG: argininosuccinate lyase [Candidatus Dormibacteria bacterium]
MPPAGKARRARGVARGEHLTGELHPAITRFTSSSELDRPLFRFDVEGSVAHVRGLRAAGLLGARDEKLLLGALARVRREMEDGTFTARPEDEDVHMAVERRVTELEPGAGPRLHTGRSRNDQVALDLRLWMRDACARLSGSIARLVETLATRAAQEAATVMPGYTHLQRGQPVTLGHHLLAYGEMLERDLERLLQAKRRAGRSPLGAGALAGSTLPLRPDVTAGLLAMLPPRNSLDAVSDRDFLLDLVYACSVLAMHLSRLGEEVVIWTTAEFGFARLPDSVATGSSLMPQKRNPDVAELLRARASAPLGALVAMLGAMKGLPLAYNRDLQERGGAFQSVDVCLDALEAAMVLIASIEFDRVALAAAASDPALLATDAAEDLVQSGVSFREAHGTVAAGLRSAPPAGSALASVRARDLPGGPAPARVRREAAAMLRRARNGTRE